MVPNQTGVCPGCDGRGWQVRNDGVKITCPMCGGTGVFAPAGTPIWMVVPSNIDIHILPDNEPIPRDKDINFRVSPGYDNPRYPDTWPWWRRDYTGDVLDEELKPKVIC